MIDVKEVHRGLMRIANALSKFIELPHSVPIPAKPGPLRLIQFKSVSQSSLELHTEAQVFHEDNEDKTFMPVFNMAFTDLYYTIYYLDRLVNDMSFVCEAVRVRRLEAYPSLCYARALDMDMGQLVREFKGLSELTPIPRVKESIELSSGNFLSMLKLLSVTCSWATEATCLRYAGPESVTPAPLRAYLSDLLSAIRTLDRRLVDLYYGIRRWRVGVVDLYEHPQTTPELSDLAEHTANILNKLVEMGVITWEPLIVYSLKDRITVLMEAFQGTTSFKNIVVKPGWVIDIYMSLIPQPFRVLKRVLAERGFKTEETGYFVYYKLRVTIPPGDIRELLKTALPVMTVAGTDEEELYETALERIATIESELKEQKPLRKRKAGL